LRVYSSRRCVQNPVETLGQGRVPFRNTQTALFCDRLRLPGDHFIQFSQRRGLKQTLIRFGVSTAHRNAACNGWEQDQLLPVHTVDVLKCIERSDLAGEAEPTLSLC